MANVNYSVMVSDMLIAGGTGSEINTAAEFQLLDDTGTIIQTVNGTGIPPIHGLFLNVDNTQNYQWKVRQEETNLGWSDWSDPCEIINVEAP